MQLHGIVNGYRRRDRTEATGSPPFVPPGRCCVGSS